MTDTARGGRRVRGSRSGERASRRPDGVLLLVLAVVALVATVAGVLSATRRLPVYGAGAPEGVVQAYLAAVIDGNHDEAARFLAPESPCTVADLDRAQLPDGVRVVLRNAAVTGDAARVDVDVAMSSGDLFGGSETFEKHTFGLTHLGGSWRVTGEPWPMSGCARQS